MYRAVKVILLLVVAVLIGCTDEPPAESTIFSERTVAGSVPLLIEGATIVDVHTGELLSGLAVSLKGGLIDKIVPVSELDISPATQRIDASGKFIVPGYMDMHAHPLGLENPHSGLALMLANGVTGFRQMSGDAELLALRKQGDINSVDFPELLAMPGRVLIPQIADSPEQARATVRQQKSEGADFIKAVAMQRDVYLAALDEASALGLPFVGHLPEDVSVRSAISHDMRAIEHLGPDSSLFLSCSLEEEEIRQELASVPPALPPALPDFLASLLSPIIDRVIKKTLANPVLVKEERSFELMQRMIDSFDEDKCKQLATDIAVSELWQVPTLIRLRAMEFGDADVYQTNENLKYMPRKTLEFWSSVGEDFESEVTQDQRKILEEFYVLQERLVKIFDQAGVKMLAGSDLGGQWLVPGFSLHQEFELLEQAGVSPLSILQMTTLNAAKFLGREDEFGTVEQGKVANLVMLSQNPLVSSLNLQDISGVFHNGFYLDDAALEALKTKYRQH
jgi:imidazolonepropionase-like amidohydrolase